MQCDRARLLMCDALDGAATGDLEEHLSVCATCAAEWRAVRSVDALLAAQPPIEPPPHLASRIASYVETRSRRAPAWQVGLLRVGAVVTGTVLAVVTATFLLHGWSLALDAALPFGWPDLGGWATAALVLVDGAFGVLDPRPLYALVAIVVALMWFGALVAPRYAPFTSLSRRRRR